MNDQTENLLKKSYKPYDIVQYESGPVGFIREVNINECQPGGRVSYAVDWFNGDLHNAWFVNSDLKVLCNMFIKIAEVSCHPMGFNDKYVKKIFDNF